MQPYDERPDRDCRRNGIATKRARWLTLPMVFALLMAACAAPPAAPAQPQAPAATAPPAAAEATQPPPAPPPSGKFTYWGGLIFSDVANQMLVDKITEWGKARGIEVDVVMINQNETQQKVSAAVEAGTMPDALDMGTGLMQLLAKNGQLEPLDDVFKQIGDAHGGWLPSAAKSVDPATYGGSVWGIPFGLSGNLINRRHDLLSAKGFNEAPKTWEELGRMAEAVNDPPNVYGMGFALSNVGDGNLTVTMLQTWGGRIADDQGKNCTIDSPETRAFMEWITGLYKKGLFPPGVTTWDGAGDNQAYQAGQAAFIANPGSVYLNLRNNDPELLAATRFSGLPAGPKLQLQPYGPNVRAIPVTSRYKDLAKDLLVYLADDEFMKEYYANAIYGPVLNSQVDFPVFKESPIHIGLLDVAKNGTPPAFPDVDNPAYAEFNANFLIPKMIQRVVVDNVSIDDAVKETQA
ncbi:MAG: extracellular solute-binding protein, partial [Anaerolineae bacterium]|nr:extracellular solute-binding protein [Candidatus Roseilinea sp.]MDW8451794.1 extracellular solute-binding protein [Anaerolineae bacterium]